MNQSELVIRARAGETAESDRVLRERVRAYLDSGKARRVQATMLPKAIAILCVTLGWYLTALRAPSGAPFVLSCVALGLALACAGFNVHHDSNHGALSRSRIVNRLGGFLIDVMGGSSIVWRRKHNTIHHSFANIVGRDDDLDLGRFARLAPQQRWCWWHGWQHIYLFVAYALLTIKWQIVDDVAALLRNRIGGFRLAADLRLAWVQLVIGRLIFVSLSILIPSRLRSWSDVVVGFCLVSITLSLTLSTTFQLAHCVTHLRFFPSGHPSGHGRPTRTPRMLASLETTADFAPQNGFITFMTGGLNYQIEHHLFPRLAHVHYPHIAPIVRRLCAELGLPYHVKASFRAALISHYRHLREMGRPDVIAELSSASIGP